MLKRVLYGSGAMGVLAAGYLLGSVSLGGAFAQTAPTATPAQSQTAPATTAPPARAGRNAPPPPAPPAAKEHPEPGQPEASEQAESAALAGQAKITAAQAN